MAKQTVIVSDLTGEVIPDGKIVHVRLSNGNAVAALDVSRDEEVIDMLFKAASPQKKRGRRPKAAEPVPA